MKYLLLLIPLLLVGCWCKNPQIQTIESVVGCNTHLRSPNVYCIVKTVSWGTREIAQREVAKWSTFTSCE